MALLFGIPTERKWAVTLHALYLGRLVCSESIPGQPVGILGRAISTNDIYRACLRLGYIPGAISSRLLDWTRRKKDDSIAIPHNYIGALTSILSI